MCFVENLNRHLINQEIIFSPSGHIPWLNHRSECFLIFVLSVYSSPCHPCLFQKRRWGGPAQDSNIRFRVLIIPQFFSVPFLLSSILYFIRRALQFHPCCCMVGNPGYTEHKYPDIHHCNKGYGIDPCSVA